MISAVVFENNCFYSALPPAISLDAFYGILKHNTTEVLVPKNYFEEPNPGPGDREVTDKFNEILATSPNYLLPKNYTKVTETVIDLEYKCCIGKKSQKIVIEIIDEILSKNLRPS